jgi:hypothetical protein
MRVFFIFELGNPMHIDVKSTVANKCPKFNTCNAPVCPLEEEWTKRKHLSGDKCCVYLLESSKLGARLSFDSAGLGNLYQAIEVVKKDLLASSATIKRSYIRAAITPTRLKPKFFKANKS